MKQTNYKRLSLRDRVVIQALWGHNGITKTEIARRLSRNKSTICREINLWAKNKEDTYDASRAQWYADEMYASKHFKDKLTCSLKLREYVFTKLKCQWSPQQIAGRISQDHPHDPVMTISHETIYSFIYRHPQGNINKKLIKLLPQQRTRRRKTYVTKGVSKTKISDAISIDARPSFINDRSQIGHWEGDLMIGPNQSSAIATLVERKTRFTFILKVKDRKSETVTTQIRNKLNSLPIKLRQSMTYDNGSEMANHKWLTQMTGAKVYFAHPYSSWERGTNENTNGLIRRYLPKKTDFHKISYQELLDIQEKLNNRPRKILGYRTPLEAFNKYLKSLNHKLQSVNVWK